MNRTRRILHPTDFSSASGLAFEKAVELARRNKAELLLLHVMVPVVPYVGAEDYAGPGLYKDLQSRAKREAQAALLPLVKRAQKHRVKAQSVLLTGVPHEQIVRAAKNRRADLIVIGTHGRTGISKFFMGSVAGRVIAMAHCPVLTVRGK